MYTMQRRRANIIIRRSTGTVDDWEWDCGRYTDYCTCSYEPTKYDVDDERFRIRKPDYDAIIQPGRCAQRCYDTVYTLGTVLLTTYIALFPETTRFHAGAPPPRGPRERDGGRPTK